MLHFRQITFSLLGLSCLAPWELKHNGLPGDDATTLPCNYMWVLKHGNSQQT